MSLEDAKRCSETLHGQALDPEAIREVLVQLVDTGEVKEAAKPEYLKTVDKVLSDILKFRIGLRFETIEDQLILGSVPSSSARKLHAISASKHRRKLRNALDLHPEDDLLSRPIEDWSTEDLSELLDVFVDQERTRLGIIDHLASSTDALCCDRLISHEDYARAIAALRGEKQNDESL